MHVNALHGENKYIYIQRHITHMCTSWLGPERNCPHSAQCNTWWWDPCTMLEKNYLKDSLCLPIAWIIFQNGNRREANLGLGEKPAKTEFENGSHEAGENKGGGEAYTKVQHTPFLCRRKCRVLIWLLLGKNTKYRCYVFSLTCCVSILISGKG